MAAEMAERSIKAFGNAIALAGRGKEDLAGAVLQMSQMVANGKLAGDELNIIAERIPQIRKQMKVAFGTSSTEEIAKMGLSIDTIVEKMISGLESLPQASSGAITTLDNLSDELEKAMLPIGRGIIDMFMTSSESAGQLMTMVGSVATSIGQIFTAVASSGAIQEMFQILIQGLGGFGVGFEQTMIGVITHMMSIAAFIPQLFQAVLADVQMMVSTFFNNFSTTWQNIFKAIGAAFVNIGISIYNGIVLILDPIVAYINALTGNIFKLKNLQMKSLVAPDLTHIREYQFDTTGVVNKMSEFQQRAQAGVLSKMGPQPALPSGLIFGGQQQPPGNQPTPMETTLNRIENNTRQTADELTKRQIGGGQIAQLGVTAAEMRASRGLMPGAGYQSSAVMGGSIIERQIRALTMDQIRRSGTYGIPRG